MAALLTPLLVAATLLIVSGASKWRRPRIAAEALRAAGLPRSHGVVRSLGTIEIVVGASFLVSPNRGSAVALTVVYAALAVFVLRLLTSPVPARTCGCFGRAEAPPSWLHLAVDLLAAGFAGSAAAFGTSLTSLPALVARLGPAGIAYVAGIAAAAYLTVTMLELLPSMFTSFDPGGAG